MIQEWFNSGCPYIEGVDIYEKKGGDKNFVKLMRKKESPFLVKKLNEELYKILDLEKPIEKASEVVEQMNKKTIAHYPVELHEVFLNRKRTYFESDALKLKLNTLPDDAEQEALEIQLQIYQLRLSNRKCWQILDHYDATKRIMEFSTNKTFNHLSSSELWKRRQLNYQNISKRERTIIKLENELNNESLVVKNRFKLEMKIAKKKEELQQLKNENETLTKLINK